MSNIPVNDEEAQKATIQSYNDHIEEYVVKANDNDIRLLAYWPGVEFFLAQLCAGQEIFEIGSGSGNDALRIENKGFQVRRSDAAEEFLRLMRSNGCEAEYYDVLGGPVPGRQHAVFANAVFLHFSLKQFRAGIRHVHNSLNADGWFCIGMKLGSFEGWHDKGLSGKRYFKFWELEELQKEIIEAGFRIAHSYVTLDRDFVVITAKLG